MTLKKNISKIRKIITKSKNPLMFFDSDTDGATSYLQLRKKFPKIIGFPMNKNFEKQRKLLDKIDNNTDLILIFDIPVLTEEFLSGIDEDITIVWVDHHPTNSQVLIDKYNIIHLNPLNFDKNDNRPACYISYKIANIRENLWLCALGSVSDFFLLDIIKKFYSYDKENFNILFNIENTKRKDLLRFLKKYSFNDSESKDMRDYWIRYLTYETGVIELKNLFDFVYKLKDTGDVLRAIKLLEKMSILDMKAEISAQKGFLFEDYGILMSEYKIILKKALKKAIKKESKTNNNKIFLFEYTAKISFTKTLSEELCYKLCNRDVIGILFKKEDKNFYNGSFRGNNFKVNDLVTTALKGLNGVGGGHSFAAGMSVAGSDYETFKKRVIDLVNKS